MRQLLIYNRLGVYMRFAIRLESKMKELGFNQTQLAAKIGVSKNAVNKWLNGGTITIDNATKLADVLGVEASWLIFGVDDIEKLKANPVDLAELNKNLEKLPPQYQSVINDIIEALVSKYGQ